MLNQISVLRLAGPCMISMLVCCTKEYAWMQTYIFGGRFASLVSLGPVHDSG